MEPDNLRWLEGLVSDALAGKEISAWERSFLEDQRKRLEEFGENIRMSPKQWAILDRIAKKIGYSERDDASHD